MSTKKPTAAELRAQESQAWRDFALSLVPKFERIVEIIEALSKDTSRPERLVGAVLDGTPALVKELQALLSKLQPELPPIEFICQLCELGDRYAMKKITIGTITLEWPPAPKREGDA